MGARHPSLDAGDRDIGDLDASEVVTRPVDIRHLSHAAASLPPPPTSKTPLGLKYLESLRQRSASPVDAKPTRRPVNITCWKDTPQLYRRMVVAAAGLSADVANKIDRDLSETEKVMLRSAIADMRLVMQGLVSL